MYKKTISLVSLLVLLASLLVGCAPTAAPTTAPEPTAVVSEPTTAPEPTVAVSEPTTAPEPTTRASEPGTLLLATTTSTQDSGLLDDLLPEFEKVCNCKIDVVAVGTGQALALGEDGNADVLLVHARAKEDEFMDAGHGVRREDVMYNDFIIVGPESDPAGIKGITNAADALKKIAEAGTTPFISRGDESGTHTKELSVWKAAGIEPAGDWYVSTGQGMGEVLTMAEEQEAYTLTDRATYLARTKEGLTLKTLVEGDKVLFNPYGVIVVNPDKGPQINSTLANTFTDWIVSVPVQEQIAQFGLEDFGQSLFIPDSTLWNEAQGGAEPPAGGAPALKLTGPAQEIAWTEDELKALGTIDVDYTDKDGKITTYTGVPLAKLLEQAGVQGDGVTLALVASDGYAAEVPLADAQGCADCIVAFDPEGGLRAVMPGMSGKAQVKGLAEIQVKGGAGAEQPSGGIPENAALKVTGKVAQEIGWTEEAVRAMDAIEAESTNKEGQTSTYTGVPIKTLLALAGPAADATTLPFVADDGYTAEAPLADVLACDTCIISFREKGGFSTVLPGFSGQLQVKGANEIQVK